jgi:hypothetical protein
MYHTGKTQASSQLWAGINSLNLFRSLLYRKD